MDSDRRVLGVVGGRKGQASEAGLILCFAEIARSLRKVSANLRESFPLAKVFAP